MLRGAFLFAALAAFVTATILYFELTVTFRFASYITGGLGLVVLALSLSATNSVLECIGHIIQAFCHWLWMACTFWWR